MIHAKGDLLLLGLVDELGEAAARHVIPGDMRRLAALDPVAQAEDPGPAQERNHPACFRQPSVHAGLEELL